MNAAVVFSLYFYTILGTVGAAAETQPVRRFLCQTRLTSRKPTCDNIFREEARGASGAPEVEFNHDQVGISRPTCGDDAFPSFAGHPTKIEQRFTCHSKSGNATSCSTAYSNGWRILRFRRRVGYGEACYRRVRTAALAWDFDHGGGGKKSLGIVSAAAGPRPGGAPRDLATFAALPLPRPLPSLFAVNPVRVIYAAQDARALVPRCLASSTAYATRAGHLLAGEERVTVVWRRRGATGGAVDVEVASFSRAAPSRRGRLVWPLIGRMQRRFFLAEVEHLAAVGRGE